MKENSNSKSELGEPRGGKPHGFKKKGGSRHKRLQSTENEFFRGVGFYVGREGPELYMKKWRDWDFMYVHNFKYRSVVKNCLLQ